MYTEKSPKYSLGFLVVAIAIFALGSLRAQAEFDSGSDGRDGALTPAPGSGELLIDMRDHPDGIYQYTDVNIPTGVIVTFFPNAANTPVTWLVQGSVVVDGLVSLDGQSNMGMLGGEGGPGGFRGGNGIQDEIKPGPGQGPGGGLVIVSTAACGGHGAYATSKPSHQTFGSPYPSGNTYGSRFLLPLLGGSGGSGSGNATGVGGSGAGGAILIAANTSITVSGVLSASGAASIGGSPPSGSSGGQQATTGGCGSGGGIRLVSATVIVSGTLGTAGGAPPANGAVPRAGYGWIRLEGAYISVTGAINGIMTSSKVPGILILPENVAPNLAITRIAGVPVVGAVNGQLDNADIVLPSNIENPVEVLVACKNILPNTLITVQYRPESGAMSYGTAPAIGNLAESTATVQLNLPQGLTVIYAIANSEILPETKRLESAKELPISATGLAPNGERFAGVEVAAPTTGAQRTVYITGSGVRFELPAT